MVYEGPVLPRPSLGHTDKIQWNIKHLIVDGLAAGVTRTLPVLQPAAFWAILWVFSLYLHPCPFLYLVGYDPMAMKD